jgi:flavin-dependent dehydrogenase
MASEARPRKGFISLAVAVDEKAYRFDVAVIGGGPAGATAARLLREWGHSVVLLQRPAGPRPPLAVSVPPSTRKILTAVGALRWVEEAGFLRTRGNTSWWGTEEPRVERFSEDGASSGFQMLRADLEELLLRHAASAGVLVRDLRVRQVRFEDPEVASLQADGPEGSAEICAREVLDASGRAGVVARHGFRVKDGPVTLALAAVWRREGGFPVPDDSDTLVEAYAKGWAWSVPVAPGLRHVTVMVDPPPPTEKRRDLASLYATELGSARHLHAALAGSQRLGSPWVADASTYGARAFAASRLLLTGDAASFIDPLSSFGVKKALASGWLAAVAAHTALRHPDRAEMARGFFARREGQVYARYAGEAARHAEQASAHYPGSAFWKARAAGSSVEPDDCLATDAAIQAAFEALKSRPRLHLGLGRDVQIAPAPVVVEREIVAAEALVRGSERAVHFVGGLRAATLARLASRVDGVGELYDAYNRQAPAVILGEFLHDLATLVASGLLCHEKPEPPR